MTFSRLSEEDRQHQRDERREANMRGLVMPSRSLHRGVYAGGTAPAPKSQAYRDPVLLEMARGRPCLLLVPGICNHRTDTTVAAHSNLSIHGKAKSRKADDVYSCWSCAACHYWLDFGKAAAVQKESRFALGHANQVLAWRLVESDTSEPERFRAAARRALARLDATPMGDTL